MGQRQLRKRYWLAAWSAQASSDSFPDHGIQFDFMVLLRGICMLLQDPATGQVIGDSFDIATYLEDHFPDSGGCLFPHNSTGTGLDYQSPYQDTAFFAPLSLPHGFRHKEYAQFNLHVDTTFSANVLLVAQFLPFNPSSADAVRAVFVKRAHLQSWEDLCIQGEVRQQLLQGCKQGLATLADLYKVHESGPFLEGSQPSYADLVVGGWLNMFSVTLPEQEWKDFRSWHDGVFARLHDALQQDYFVCK
jgi:glutathione S-transferase